MPVLRRGERTLTGQFFRTQTDGADCNFSGAEEWVDFNFSAADDADNADFYF